MNIKHIFWGDPDASEHVKLHREWMIVVCAATGMLCVTLVLSASLLSMRATLRFKLDALNESNEQVSQKLEQVQQAFEEIVERGR